MDNRVTRIRENERSSHTKVYTTEKLYESDGWLKKPIKTVEETTGYFEVNQEIRILDLGSGVGRNAIFLAKHFENINSGIDCVDILPLAIEILRENAEKHNVSSKINGIVSSIESFDIKPNYYDLIIGISSLEHIDTFENFCEKLKDIKDGLKDNGLVCLVINTNVSEFDKNSRQPIEPNFEINITTEELIALFNEIFCDYDTIKLSKSLQKYDIPRDDLICELTSVVVTFVGKKKIENSIESSVKYEVVSH